MDTDERTGAEASGRTDNDGKQDTSGDRNLSGMPQVNFSTFILSLASSALVHLGEVPDPSTNKIAQNLPMARHTIDILSMLEQKTRECLDPDERRLLGGILYDLRLKFVMKNR